MMDNNGTRSTSFSKAGFDITGIENLALVKVVTLYNSEIKIMALCYIFMSHYTEVVLHCSFKHLCYQSFFHFT